jgi:hypothetical protein
MIIAGIDPGPKEAALVFWDGQHVLNPVIIESSYVELALTLAQFDAIACEHLQCQGMAVGSETFETAYWIGEYRLLARQMGKPFHRVYRSEVKMTLCGTTFGVSLHMWSALAVAVAFSKRKEQV